jgi:hypothetical protein
MKTSHLVMKAVTTDTHEKDQNMKRKLNKLSLRFRTRGGNMTQRSMRNQKIRGADKNINIESPITKIIQERKLTSAATVVVKTTDGAGIVTGGQTNTQKLIKKRCPSETPRREKGARKLRVRILYQWDI